MRKRQQDIDLLAMRNKLTAKQQRMLIKRQSADLDQYIVPLYYCVACRRMKPLASQRFYYIKPTVETIAYGGDRKAVPCLCKVCTSFEHYNRPWVRRWWYGLGAGLPLVRLVAPNRANKSGLTEEKIQDSNKGES
jgi:hypothetical protein